MKLLLTIALFALSSQALAADDYTEKVKEISIKSSNYVTKVLFSAKVLGGGCHTVDLYPDFEVVKMTTENGGLVFKAHLKILSDQHPGLCRKYTYPTIKDFNVSKVLTEKLEEAGWKKDEPVSLVLPQIYL